MAIGFPTIYGGRPVTRHVYPVRADIQPGNSGSPLLKPDGSVYGMVFGAFGHAGAAGYALAAGEVLPDARAAASRTAAASTQPWHCPAGPPVSRWAARAGFPTAGDRQVAGRGVSAR